MIRDAFQDWFAPRKRLMQQASEIRRLQKELADLQAQNTSMREGMRRCVTCEYRIEFKKRQGEADNNLR